MNNLSNSKVGSDQSQSPEMAKKNQVTSFADIEKALKVLQAHKDKWVATSIDERINF